MFNGKRTALYVALGAIAFTAGEAYAGCKYIPDPPGSLVCASWIRGSEICDILLTGINTPLPSIAITSASCNVTGFTFIDGQEGSVNSTGIYCASGNLPPGNLVCGSKPKKNGPTVLTTTLISPFTIGNTAPTNGNAGPCKHSTSPPNGSGNAYGHYKHDCVPDIIFPPSFPGPFDTFEANAPVTCTGTGASLTCHASAELLPPAGSTCQNGGNVVDFTATQMLAYVDFCYPGSSGTVCDTIFDVCTLNNDGSYSCIDISDQPDFGPDPLSSSCGID